MLNIKTRQKDKKSDKTNSVIAPIQIPLKQKCSKIVAGAFHSYAITKDTVYLWGKKIACNCKEDSRMKFNQGIEDDKIIELPIKIKNLATGPKHTFAWNERQVYCWGSNENYELGLEQQKDYGCQKVELFEQAMNNGYILQQIQCGQSHTLAIFRVPEFQKVQELFPSNIAEINEKEQDNQQEAIQMFAWGKSDSNQLTINSVNIIPYPVLTPCSFKHLTSVHSKSDYNVALCNSKVYSWGANLFSRLGHAQSKARIPQQVTLPEKIHKIGIGNHHVVAVSITGSAYAWGKGDLGQLGIDRFEAESRPSKMICDEQIIDAACGDLHTLVRVKSNKLKTCGGNKNGALGHSAYDPSDKKKRCKKLLSVQNQQIFGKILMIACGSHHNLVLNDSGQVFGWGNNDYHQILPTQEKKQLQGSLTKPPKKPQKIIIDEQMGIGYRNEEESSQVSIFLHLQRLQNWKRRYNIFRQQKSRQEEAFMKEHDQIVGSLLKRS